MRSLVARFLVLCTALLVSLGVGTAGAGAQSPGESQPIPVLAYYYIWFNPTSWNRAKTDYPLLGRYSSDEQRVMRRHIRWAKEAGIDGFIVSWKSTPDLNPRLDKLIDIARTERFKLAIIYQGLDFSREPLPAERVASDFDYFADRYAGDEVFSIFGKPAIIWSGTWRFSRRDVASVTRDRRERLLILASEKNADDYRRLQGLVDGDAYYWSSVNPDTFPGYPEKLQEMASTIHDGGGLWIAPAAPGFDARLVGGTMVVPRKDGATLREQVDAAISSSPDALGLISWNEFSENSHVEPSEKHGDRYLRVLADVNGETFSADVDLDSSDPSAGGIPYALPLIVGFALFFLAGGLIVRRRSARGGDEVAEVDGGAPGPGGDVAAEPDGEAPGPDGEAPRPDGAAKVEGDALEPPQPVGETAVVSRDNGAPLGEEIDVAIGSSSDAFGLTSGNEHGGSSQAEPSEEQAPLPAAADLNGETFRADLDLGSSEPAGRQPSRLPLVAGVAAFFLAGRLIRRRRRVRR
jgi:hypothetical protein